MNVTPRWLRVLAIFGIGVVLALTCVARLYKIGTDKAVAVASCESDLKTFADMPYRLCCTATPALADYILVFRAPGENDVPILPDITDQQWIEWARPVWYGIRETETLQAPQKQNDERHIAPLQLGVIERCIRLWSNPGETILDPFSGIASTGYEAVRHGRRFVGAELKREYFEAWRRQSPCGRESGRDSEPLEVGP